MSGKNGSYCCCRCCTLFAVITSMVVVGIIVTCLGAAAIPLFKDLYKSQVEKEKGTSQDVDVKNQQLVISVGNEAYNAWKEPPAPVYMEYYIFNYTNFEDVVKKNAKPNVTQVGPYKYREARMNTIISQNPYNITYLQNYSYIFEPSLSCANCSMDDIFYTPNTPILTIAKKLHDFLKNATWWEKPAFKLFNIYLDGKPSWTLFTKLTVKQLLWGYTDPFLLQLEEILAKLKKLHIKIPGLPDINPFVQLQQNGTAGAMTIGNLTIVTGKNDIDKVQSVVQWRGLSEAPYWLTKYGRMINGSDGSHARPFTTTDDRIYVFTAQLCRSLYFDFLQERELMGIHLYRFHTTSNLFANHTVNPDNYAFCNDEKCWGSGLLPVDKCQVGQPPVFMSAPHFYQGDPSLSEAINGLHPNESLHATYLDVEPTTGITMEAHKKLQINILVQKDDGLTLLTHLQDEDNFLPVLWIHEEAIIDKASADKFKNEVMKPKEILTGVQYGLLGIGLLIILCAVIVGVAVKRKQYTRFENVDDDEKVI